MAINLFGITPATVSGSVQNLTISTSTSPTTDAVEDIILLAAAEVEREADVVGIDTQSFTDDGSATYLILKRMVLNRAIAELLVARERGNAAAGQYYIDRYEDLRGHLRVRPSIVADKTTGPDRLDYIEQSNATIHDIEFFNTVAGSIALYGI